MAEQLTAMNGPVARGPWLCRARASNSFPVPLSPINSTGVSLHRGTIDQFHDVSHRVRLRKDLRRLVTGGSRVRLHRPLRDDVVAGCAAARPAGPA